MPLEMGQNLNLLNTFHLSKIERKKHRLKLLVWRSIPFCQQIYMDNQVIDFLGLVQMHCC
jgi:hypothetical protein